MDTKTATPRSEFGFGTLEYLGLDDYRRILLRRKWMIVSGALLTGLVTAIVVTFLPNVYRAKTVILVDPRKVSDKFVASTATAAGMDRMANLRAQILSNTRLSQLIDEMNLYPKMKYKNTRDEIIAQMRQDIGIDIVATTNEGLGVGAFQISYASKNPTEAAQVANRLASLFIKENLEARQAQVLGTADFIDRELQEAKQELDAKASKLRELKARHMAELPESEGVRLQALSAMQLQVRAEMDAIDRAQQQRVYLQSLLAESAPVVNLDAGKNSSGTAGLEDQLARLQSDEDQLRTRYGSDYPDVRRKEVDIARLQEEIEKIQKQSRPATAAPRRAEKNPVIESQLAALTSEIEKHEAREKELGVAIAVQQSKLEKVPAFEEQLSAISRDYQLAEDRYKRLQEGKFVADMSSDLEDRQKGERFVILDPAQTPERPYSPNRLLIDAIGLVAGLFLSGVLGVALEMFGREVTTEQEIRDSIRSPVLGEIPWILTEATRRRQTLRLRLAAAGSAFLILMYLVVVAHSAL